MMLALALAAGPGDWVIPGFRLHVMASEELEPDRLRALARPDVVLWVRTWSNGLRRSTAETVREAGSAFVQVRPPLGAPALAPFVGRVGPWVEERGLDVRRVRRWSPGRLAVDVEGPLTGELVARIRVLRPIAVRWRRGGWPEHEEWVRAGAFPGVELGDLGSARPDCGAIPARTRCRVRVLLETLPSEGVCGLPLRIELPAGTDAAAVQAALVAHPGAELLVEVGDETARADAAARLLDRLVAATPRATMTERGAAAAQDAGGR
jgi:hypothetical protein